MAISSMAPSLSSLSRPSSPHPSPLPFISPKIPPFFGTSFPLLSQSPARKSPTTRALRGWREYEEAVKDKDLARALRFLKSIESLPLQSSPHGGSSGGLLQLQRPERDWEVLDACLNADDMKLVGSTYKFLHDRGFLPNFGKCKNIGNSANMFEGLPKADSIFLVGKKCAGLSIGGIRCLDFVNVALLDIAVASCFSQDDSGGVWAPPYRRDLYDNEYEDLSCLFLACRGSWLLRVLKARLFGALKALVDSLPGPCINFLLILSKGMTGIALRSLAAWLNFENNECNNMIQNGSKLSFLLSQGIDIRPNLAAILGLAMLDAIFLGGSCLAQISCLWPPYRRRILVHEAGHLLTAYLMGCPVRGVILDPIVAMQMGIQGQAGTQFWDEKLENELAEGRLSSASFDRYCMVLFAGIAAEALVYGEAEGGENDENLFRSISVLLQPPLSIAQMSNQARWSVLQSYNLLKWHKHAHRAAVRALESGNSLSVVIRTIEEAILSKGVEE
ncbi:uncharacterized protein LOC131244663 [Magnolia sinica]|uniref:uncharacterized protein LOC131244663 n=1 Tax=Magnolia sinica TaxID=86752 RepID=UPI002659BE2C|nr:uncharacterized protein LOC131244663 [Magnolia sinica]